MSINFWRLLPGLTLLGAATCPAQIVTDGTVGPRATLSGPDMTIGAELGTTKGANLFHSFQTFDIPTAHTATFTGPDQIQNVISRVTGGKASQLDGTLRSRVGKADVFLVNPSGVVMGPNARVDVPAAFHVSTADEVRFTDGSRYSASDPASSSLTMAAPESFGFLSPQPASLTINGSQLELKPGKTATLTAGDVSIAGTSPTQRAGVNVAGGTIRVEAVGGRGKQVPVNAASQTAGTGKLSIKHAGLGTIGDGGGQLSIRAGEIDLDNGWLFANNIGTTDVISRIDLTATSRLTLTNQSSISSSTAASGQAGNISIRTGELQADGESAILSGASRGSEGAGGSLVLDVTGLLRLSGKTWIGTDTWGSGQAGEITVQAGRLELFSGATISSNIYGGGNAGQVAVHADELHLDGLSTGVMSLAAPGSQGRAGRVVIEVTKLARLSNDAFIGSDSYGAGNAGGVSLRTGALEAASGADISSNTYRQGHAGTVSVQAAALHLTGINTSIASTSGQDASGQAGDVTIDVDGLARLQDGAWIGSDTLSTADAGQTLIRAGMLELSGDSSISSNTLGEGAAGNVEIDSYDLRLNDNSWITSLASLGATGRAGQVWVKVKGQAVLSDRSSILSSTFGPGDAGQVSVRAKMLNLLDVARIDSSTYSSGNAGKVDVAADRLHISGAHSNQDMGILSTTFAEGQAGSVTVKAGALRIDGAGSEHFIGITSGSYPQSTGNAGTVSVAVSGLLELLGGGQIDSSTYSSGNAGQVDVTAGMLHISGAGSSQDMGILSATLAEGHAGPVTVKAGALRIDGAGSGDFTGITSGTYPQSTGNAGTVNVEVTGLLELLGGAQIDSSAYSSGNAGEVLVKAGELRIDHVQDAPFETGISSRTQSSGNANRVTVDVRGLLDIANGGKIDSTTFAAGNADVVTIHAGTAQLLNGSSIESQARRRSTGQAGAVNLHVDGLLDLRDGSEVFTDTWGTGNAGTVTVTAGNLRLDNARLASQANTGSTGEAGDVSVTVDNLLELLHGGVISTSTWARGQAGDIVITAGNASLDGGGTGNPLTTIYSDAYAGSSGDAGTVTMQIAGLLEARHGAIISTNAWSVGNAGDVEIQADRLRLVGAGILSAANPGASGQVGKVTVRAANVSLNEGAQISIAANHGMPVAIATSDQRIRIDSGRLLLDRSAITAASTGNVPASAIQIHADDLRLAHDSRITTEASQADAGPIAIGGGRLWLTDSLITTSANGQAGNGGDITLTPDYLILDGGFIQANTAAQGARGGNILIDSRALIASQGLLEIGGATRQDFAAHSGRNIIQAAAPGGEQGVIKVTAPDLDLTASLTPLATPFDDPDELFADLCRIATGDQASSLIERGSGGLAPAPDAPGAVSLGGTRLDRILAR